jgi:hypothetical protein
MSYWRVTVGALLVVLALGAAALAADLRSWPHAISRGDKVYAASPARASWVPSTHLGGLAGDLLRTQPDLSYRRALRLYRATAGLQLRLDNAAAVSVARARAEDSLARAARDPNNERSSQAQTLLGVLAFGDPAGGGRSTQVDNAELDFRGAIEANPRNDDAKYDLELLLRLTAANGTRVGPGPAGPVDATGRKGAGTSAGGSGY